MKNNEFWAVIPCYNESKHISAVIRKVKKYAKNIVVVDDGSKDASFGAAKKEKVIALRHIVNLGKGAALKTGCDYAIKYGAQKIVVLDSDGQHDPEEIPKFIKALNTYKVVIGARKRTKRMPFILRFGNFVIYRITKLLYDINISDTQSGYRAFTREAYKKIRWDASDYSMESEMIARIGKQKLPFTQIPIKTIYSDKYKGTTIIDGIKIVLNMIWWRIAI